MEPLQEGPELQETESWTKWWLPESLSTVGCTSVQEIFMTETLENVEGRRVRQPELPGHSTRRFIKTKALLSLCLKVGFVRG